MSPATLLEATGWALFHATWQVGLIALGLALRLRRPAGDDHDTRHRIACAAMLLALAVPLCGVLYSLARPLPAAAPPSPALLAADIDAPPRSLTPVPATRAVLDAAVSPSIPWLAWGWAAGVGALLAWWSLGAIRLQRWMLRSRPLDPPSLSRIRSLARRTGLDAGIPVRTTTAVHAPVLVGLLRPVVLLPESALDGVPSRFVDAAVLHELVHVRRRDPWTHRAQLVARTLLFFHPGVWWISRRIAVEREHACDDAVVALTHDPLGYARALAGLEAHRGRLASHAIASNGGSLMARIENILASRRSTAPSPRRWPLALGAGVLTLVLVAAALLATPPLVADDAPIAWLPESIARWTPEFRQAAAEHGVDVSLLAVMTLVESRGNPDARSSMGSLGLMQVLPATAKKIASSRGIDDFDVEQLRDPATNIDFGAWYLARQLDRFGSLADGDQAVLLAAAAYNGGPGMLSAHLDRGEPLSDEARRYSKLVHALWLDRDKPRSSVFEEYWSGRGTH